MFLFFPFFGMFYIKNRITSAIPILEANIYLCWKQTRPIMCRLNINKCHSCQTAGNSNFTLFLVYFLNAYSAQVFIWTHDILYTVETVVDLQVISNKRDQIFWLKLFDKNKKERVAILGSTLHASKASIGTLHVTPILIAACLFLHTSRDTRLTCIIWQWALFQLAVNQLFNFNPVTVAL
jgi:hypothetical protein